ncbi:MAG: amidohydrolase family protein [Anaerolineae bacterium]|nr:amidohydrolase family protein [Anaerolineae bacterium]
MTLDLILYNAQIADVFRLRFFEGWVGIRGGHFAYVEEGVPPDDFTTTVRQDVNGLFLAPGLVESHMHIESSLITPRRFAETVLPYGTTTILSDPHEVGNVAGEQGVRWMFAASRNLPLKIYHSIPSCVPATDPEYEWTGQVFSADVITRLAEDPSVIALGEVMDYRGLMGDNERLQAIVRAAWRAGLMVEGHIPTLRGTELSEYLEYGVGSDHTLTYPEKIEEQISKGLAVMLQTKSITPENMATVMNLPDRSRVFLVTDDLEPPLLIEGHLSRILQLAIQHNLPPLEAWASSSIRPARYMGLRNTGGIAPGFCADFVLMRDLVAFPPEAVYVDGERIAQQGSIAPVQWPNLPPMPAEYAVPGPLEPKAFRLTPAQPGTTPVMANAVVIQNALTTLTQLEQISVTVDHDGNPVFEDGDALALASIFARDGSSQMVGIIKNTGLEAGAFASTVAHDCHNLLVIGRDAVSMSRAAQEVHALGGGVAVARNDDLLASLPLPYFGLLSDAPVPEVAQKLEAIEIALRGLGMTHQRPFLLLSIMSLSVSPFVKFTDRGVIDTELRQLLPPWAYPYASEE